MAKSAAPAGGRATQAGMAFEAQVGAWFAAHLASEMPVGSRFGLASAAQPIRLRFETGEYLDDIVVSLSDGGTILVQCKTHPTLSSAAESPLADTIGQLVSFLVAHRSGTSAADLSRTAAVLAVQQDAARSLDGLHEACRYFDDGAQWAEATGRLSQDRQHALDIFATHARAAWQTETGRAATDEDVVALARLFRVVRFDAGVGGADYRSASQILGARLFEKEDQGDAALDGLLHAVGELIRTGAPANRDGLLQRLRKAGIEDTRSPCFDTDLERLRQLSGQEIKRLARHGRLPVGGGIPIARECMPEMCAAVDGGSLLVIGEPGAGKTGVLVALAERLPSTAPRVFLSVDRLAGVATGDDLRSELGLQHPVLDVLAAWPGSAPGVLIIDALDASRGGASEGVFATLIEDGMARIGDRWSIVASIRTFDLRNGRRFRTLVAGTPPSAQYADPSLGQVRHFCIPRLSDGEVQAVAHAHPELGRLAETAPEPVRKLLQNVFNLSLAAELIDQGVSADSIRGVATQADLIERYENERLPSARLQIAIRDAVAVMVERRRLTIPKIAVGNEAIDDALATGVLAVAGDRIQFAHHVLFDHAASRYYLDWDDSDRLLTQIAKDPAIGLLLGPSLRFAMERIWCDDGDGRLKIWRLILAIAAAKDVDPIVASVALRAGAERVAGPADVEGLCDQLRDRTDFADLGSTLSRVARFVRMTIGEANGLSAAAATAWTTVAKVALSRGARDYVDGARILLWSLSEKADFSDAVFSGVFGQAARALLQFAWTTDPPMSNLSSNAIQLVCKSYVTDPDASRALLERSLEEPHFSAYAHEEAPWLAEGISVIAPLDPAFALRVYATLFGRPAPQDGHSWIGGGRPSRILPLSSNRRQDYEHARWHLEQALPAFLRSSPRTGTDAVSAAVIGQATETGSQPETREVVAGNVRLRVVEDGLSLQEWRPGSSSDTAPEDQVLSTYTRFLSEASAEHFRLSVEAARAGETATSVWARIFGIAAERPGVADDLLWPLASDPAVLDVPGLSRDVITYLSAAYSRHPLEERTAFEQGLLARCQSADARVADWSHAMSARFLSVVDASTIATPEMQSLRSELESERKLAGNRPFITIETGWGATDDIADRLLERQGVNLDQAADRDLRLVTRPLEQVMRAWSKDATVEEVADLWRSIASVVDAIDQPDSPAAHAGTLHAAWGTVSNAIEKIAEAKAYDPEQSGHPKLSDVLGLVDRMADSPYPEPSEDTESRSMAWGNWDVRVYAAATLVDLARRFGGDDAAIVSRLRPFLSDLEPTVRLQVAQSLTVLWNVARPAMWEMAEQIARKEEHAGVLGAFVGRSLISLVAPEPARCEDLAAVILARQSRTDEEHKRDSFDEAVGYLTAHLRVGHGRQGPVQWIQDWAADLVRGQAYLWPLVSALRSALFERYGEEAPEAAAIQERARSILHDIVIAASRALGDAMSVLNDQDAGEVERQRAETLARAGDSLLEHACNQLYFGSGAFRSGNNEKPPGLATPDAMRLFLQEYLETLDVIGRSGTARTLHHLIELYDFIAAAAPETVFDRIAALIVGPAAREGYQFESFGSTVLVKLIRRYLADHRAVFEDEQRRASLVEVLELFSSAGWPDALQLLYELPDLLR